MSTFDTNLWVRYLTNDDPEQAARVVDLLRDEQSVFVPKTVLLELEWVLRAAYAIEPARIAYALRQLLGLPMVATETPEQVVFALAAFEQGLDFADALHLAAATDPPLFSFDQALVRKATELGFAVSKVP